VCAAVDRGRRTCFVVSVLCVAVVGFALQRANVRMLRGSSLRQRRNRAKDCFASGSRSQ
jgi:hypothetical protein